MGVAEECCDGKELAGALAVGCRDNGRVDVVEFLLLKELMNSKGNGAAYARHCAMRIGAPA